MTHVQVVDIPRPKQGWSLIASESADQLSPSSRHLRTELQEEMDAKCGNCVGCFAGEECLQNKRVIRHDGKRLVSMVNRAAMAVADVSEGATAVLVDALKTAGPAEVKSGEQDAAGATSPAQQSVDAKVQEKDEDIRKGKSGETRSPAEKRESCGTLRKCGHCIGCIEERDCLQDLVVSKRTLSKSLTLHNLADGAKSVVRNVKDSKFATAALHLFTKTTELCPHELSFDFPGVQNFDFPGVPKKMSLWNHFKRHKYSVGNVTAAAPWIND